MIDSKHDDIYQAVSILKKGGIIVYPTETVYGIGCDPLNAESFERIRKIKGRDAGKPMLLLASSFSQVETFAGELFGEVKVLAERFWPGPLTIVFRPKHKLPDYLYGPSGGIAVRVTPHVLAAGLADGLGRPVISTSANISGEPPLGDYRDALLKFGGCVDMILENDKPMDGVPSTLLDMTGESAIVLREGSLPVERIREAL